MRNILSVALVGAALAGAVPAYAASYTVSVNLLAQGGTLAAFDTSLGTLTSVTGTGVVGYSAITPYTVFPVNPYVLVLQYTWNGGAEFNAGGFAWQQTYSGTENQPFYSGSGVSIFSREMTVPGFSIDPSEFANDLLWNGYVQNSVGIGTFGSGFISQTNAFSYGMVSLLFTYDAAVEGVPEPATWAMMLLGLGGTGALLRRKRNRLALAA